MWLKKTVELGNQLKPYIYAAPLTHTALWQGRILKTWKNLHKDKYEENLREYHPHIIILMKKSISKKLTNDIYVYMKISIKTFLYIFTDFSPMSKYMLFLTLFPAPTCVSWVTFFIIKKILSRWKWRITKSKIWNLPNFWGSVYTVIAITFERFSNLRTSGRHSKVTNDAISKKQTESDIRLKIEKGKKISSKLFQIFFQTILSKWFWLDLTI